MIAWNEDVFGECDWKILPSCRREIECLRVFILFPTGISRQTIICHDPNPTYYNERKKQNHANYPLIRAIYVIKTTYAHESAIKSNYISLFTERKWIAFDDAACIKKGSTRRDLSDDSSTKSIVWNGTHSANGKLMYTRMYVDETVKTEQNKKKHTHKI